MSFPLVLCICVLSVPLFQLIPLPPHIWQLLPGHSEIASTYEQAAIPLTWRPISLHPYATWRSMLTLLPAVALFLSVLALSTTFRRRLATLLVVLAFGSVLLGLLQVLQGPESALRFYFPYTNTAQAVGFFANRNQFAALLYSVMPVSAALATSMAADSGTRKLFPIVMCLIVYVTLLLGLASAQSRAGILLGVIAGVGSLAIVTAGGLVSFKIPAAGKTLTPERRVPQVAIGGLLLVGAIAAQVLLLVALGNRESLLDEQRLEIDRITLRAAAKYIPVGSGLGTFLPVYAMSETPDIVSGGFTNHAHNDWLEVWLEAGVPAVMLAAAFLLWFFRRSQAVWGGGSRSFGSEPNLPKAGWCAVLLLLLHSTVDYPLRTEADLAVFAFACALMVPSSQKGASSRTETA